jgi:hypothetical protein
MKSHVTVMTGEKESTKIYSVGADGKCEKGEVASSFYFNSSVVEVNDIGELYSVLLDVRQSTKSFIIRGRSVKDELEETRRLKKYFCEVGTAWICCDFDSAVIDSSIGRTSQEAIEYLIANKLPTCFHNVSYVYQWSASAGLEHNGVPIKKGTNVHLFFYLDKLVDNVEFKTWFAAEIKAKQFDPSTFNTVTPIFVGSHIIKDDAIVDVIPSDEKFGIVLKDQLEIAVPEIEKKGVTPESEEEAVRSNFASFKASTDTPNEILVKIQCSDSVFKETDEYIKLWHPREKSKGDWFVYLENPAVVCHHQHSAMRVDRWFEEFWGLDIKVKFVDPVVKAAVEKLVSATANKEVTSKGNKKMLDSLSQIRADARARKVGTIVDIRIPAPEKEWAKSIGAMWDSERSTFFFRSEEPEAHELYAYRKDSDLWMKIKKKVDYNYKDVFKETGLVGEKNGTTFESWVLMNGKYEELVETLIELEYL